MSFPVDHSRCGRYVDVEHLIFPLAVHLGFVALTQTPGNLFVVVHLDIIPASLLHKSR